MTAQAQDQSQNARRKARIAVIQALYQSQINPVEVMDLVAAHIDKAHDQPFFEKSLKGVLEHIDELNEHLRPHASRPLRQLDPIERAILWLGAYEMVYADDAPHKVAINEAIELAKIYGGEDGHKFVNAMLDQLSKTLQS